MNAEMRLYRLCLALTSIAAGTGIRTASGSSAMDDAFRGICHALDADTLYTVLPAGSTWSKTGYTPDRALGSILASRPTGIARQVLAKRTRFVEAEISPRGPFQRHQDAWPGTDVSSYAAVPILRRGQPRGVLVVLRAGARSDSSFGVDDLARADLVAEAIAVRLENEDVAGGWQRLCDTDAATGLPNGRAFRNRLSGAIRRGEPGGGSIAVLLLDLGSSREDLLRRAGRRLQAAVRGSDFVASVRPGVLALLLPSTDAGGAIAACARLNDILRTRFGEPFENAAWGRATYPADATSAEGLLRAAGTAVATASVPCGLGEGARAA